ncbi:hypothetical protein K1719_004018 [Acacia pycnantha]|nr:hypothetical protein K1719_004018 [Acacia pycnantha]
MWRNLVSRWNWLSGNQTAQLLNRSNVLSSYFSPVSQTQTAPNYEENNDFKATSIPFAEATANQTDVSLSFAKHLFLKEANKNVVVSPLLIQVALSLVAAGSDGSTLCQLLSFLKIPSVDDLNHFASKLSKITFVDGLPGRGTYLNFANGIWLDQSLIPKPSFKQILDSHRRAAFAQVDFRNKVEVTQQINSWVEENTNGLVKNAFHECSLGVSDRFVFVNALHFKGSWLKKFESSKTKDYEFHLLCGSSVEVPFMTSKKRQLIRAYDGFKVLSLPCEHGFTMYIFLPDSHYGLASLVEKVGSHQSSFLENHLPQTLQEVGHLRIPKFKFSYDVMASNQLKELGLTLPFAGGELTEIADSIDGETLSVSNIFQKAFIEVDEEGREAEPGTTKYLIKISNPPSKIDFVADHPFLFLIRAEVSGAVLFVGQVLNPLAG